MLYLWLKAFHLIGVTSWFAGLFYHVRLFVYHAEALAKPEPERGILARQLAVMEARLFGIIMQPALWITVGTAGGMLVVPEGRPFASQPWMVAKYALVGLLVAYHFHTRGVMEDFAAGRPTRGGEYYRKLNEVPTLLLVAVTILAVFKGQVPWLGLGVTLATLLVLIVLGYRAYASHRARAEAAAGA
ncbi:MAG: protoporphyrinogen oxidase HemJ [Gemmatimonadales bacterium]|nr:protoporphyrinogen oxidase HemJ [Gemmatimonadales bacterium]